MRFALASVVTALAALVSAHTQPNYDLAPEGNAILKPGLDEVVPAGKPYTIHWTPTTKGPISLVLLRGPSTNVQPLVTIAEQIPNDGSFTWTPSAELEPDVTHYGLLLVVEGTGQYQYSTQFGISNPDFNGGKPTTPPQAATSTATVVNPPEETKTAITTVTTTDCPETTTVPTTTQAPTTIPVSVNTSSTTAASSSSVPVKPTTMETSSSQAPATPSASTPASSSIPSVPLSTGAASRNALSMGAVAAGAVALLAF